MKDSEINLYLWKEGVEIRWFKYDGDKQHSEWICAKDMDVVNEKIDVIGLADHIKKKYRNFLIKNSNEIISNDHLPLQPRYLHLRRLRDCAAGEGEIVDRHRRHQGHVCRCGGRDMVPFLEVLDGVLKRGVELRLIHAKEPDSPAPKALGCPKERSD